VTSRLCLVSSSESETTSNTSGDSPESDEAKSNKLDDYYNTGEPCVIQIATFLVHSGL